MVNDVRLIVILLQAELILSARSVIKANERFASLVRKATIGGVFFNTNRPEFKPAILLNRLRLNKWQDFLEAG